MLIEEGDADLKDACNAGYQQVLQMHEINRRFNIAQRASQTYALLHALEWIPLSAYTNTHLQDCIVNSTCKETQ